MRSQRPRGTTTLEGVLNAALAVIDTVGVDRLTIRSVAKLAGAPPMSLYSHFTNKNELLDLVYAEVSRRLYPDNEAPTWQAGLLALCKHVRALLTEHPRWIPLLSRPASPMDVPARERLLRQMVTDGMQPEAAMTALTSSMLTTVALVLVDVSLRDADGQAMMTKRYDKLRAWAEVAPKNEETAVTRAALSRLRRLNLEDTFLLVIQSLIAGLDAKRTKRQA